MIGRELFATLKSMRQQRTGLDYAVGALQRHLRAIAERAERSGDAELPPADLVSILRAASELRELEQARANTVLRALGRRLETMPTAEIERILDRIELDQLNDEDEDLPDAN